jgi:DNA-binding SARP family transcriptional activator
MKTPVSWLRPALPPPQKLPVNCVRLDVKWAMADVRIRLLGPPAIERPDGEGRQPRGRKAWALLAYLVVRHAAAHRSQLASLLFPDAEDPLGALRWNLSELRRALGPGAVLGGDPLSLLLPLGYRCDVDAATGFQEVQAPDLAPAGELLEGLSFADCPAYDAWLTTERHRIRNCVQTLLYEGALTALASGAPQDSAGLAGRAVEMDPFNADFHAVLIRALLATGDRVGARDHASRCAELFQRELGVGMPPEVQRALQAPARRTGAELPATPVTVRSYLDAAKSCLAAGAVDRALEHLRLATVLADRTADSDLRAESLLALAGALIHSAGGRGAEVDDLLHRALSFTPEGVSGVAAAAYRELGFVSAQRGTPARAGRWLEQAEAAAQGMPEELARIFGVRGMTTSDVAQYDVALTALKKSDDLAAATGSGRQQAFTAAMTGRVQLLLGEYQDAAVSLDRSLAAIAAEHWTAFRPLAESLRGETYLALGQLDEAGQMIEHAAVLAELSGDRCYMDASANAQVKLNVARGNTPDAAQWIARGLMPHPWYVWFRARVLDTACQFAINTNSPDAVRYAAELSDVASRSGLRELVVRAHSHRAVLGDTAAGEAIPLLARDLRNPALLAHLVARKQL